MRPPAFPSPGLAVFWALSAVSWMLVNLLAGVGVIVVLFAMMANASWEGFFREGANLAAHFLDAPAASRADFEGLLLWVLGLAVVVVGWARFGALRTALMSSGRSNADVG